MASKSFVIVGVTSRMYSELSNSIVETLSDEDTPDYQALKERVAKAIMAAWKGRSKSHYTIHLDREETQWFCEELRSNLMERWQFSDNDAEHRGWLRAGRRIIEELQAKLSQ